MTKRPHVFRGHALGLTALAAAGCAGPQSPTQPATTRWAPAGAGPAELAPRAPSAPTVAPSATPPSSPASPGVPAWAQAAGAAFCQRGGAFFSPPGSPELDTRPLPLSSCDDVKLEVAPAQAAEGASWTFLTLSVEHTGLDEERVVRLRLGTHEAAFTLARGFSSGVGAFSHDVTVGTPEVGDVLGDAAPEWWVEVEVASRDSDMGECTTRTSLKRTLVLCTSVRGSPRCLNAALATEDVLVIEPSSDPTVTCPSPRTERVGYALVAAVSDGVITFETAALGRAFTSATKPPWLGPVPIAKLLTEAPLGPPP